MNKEGSRKREKQIKEYKMNEPTKQKHRKIKDFRVYNKKPPEIIPRVPTM